MPSPSLDTLRLIVEDDAKTRRNLTFTPTSKSFSLGRKTSSQQFFGGMKETKQAIAWKILCRDGL